MLRLTNKELEVLNLAKLGEGNKQISFKLGIGIHLVKSRFKSIFNKLGVYNRTHAVYLCLRDDIIHFDGK